jgi:hypothetical protein
MLSAFIRSEKASVLAGLIKKTNALEMKWILMIILKGLMHTPYLKFELIRYLFS